ncbi:MAG: CocE/NonD family hydrolase [Gemmatimonadetes bacterium]|nr:CocE/NonD family hydrolase [Gemmatimonadota bacterium]
MDELRVWARITAGPEPASRAGRTWVRVRAAGAASLLFLVACSGSTNGGGTPQAADVEAGHVFGACKNPYYGPYGTSPVRSLHVTMRDGVRIALDVVLPDGLPNGAKVPAVLTMTRYWRAMEGEGPNEMQRFFSSHGWAVVSGDVRGTGASFGVWPHHRSRDETLDFGEVIDWIAGRPWSDGRVAGWGVSYTANTADWMVERDRPAFRGAVSRFPDYDPYVDLYFPGGVPNAYMRRTWGLRVKELDLNTARRGRDGELRGVRPVDGDSGADLLRRAIERRRDVPSVWEGLRAVTFKDDVPAGWGGWSMDDWGIHAWREAVERAGTPIISWGGWMDAGTANGVLHRFMTLSNPQRVVVGPWSHGGEHHADPYRPMGTPTDPPMEGQRLEDLCFLDRWVRGQGAGVAERLLVYYTMGEERWKTTSEWPVPKTTYWDWYFAAGGGLGPEAPSAQAAADEYVVDFGATTGTANRWATNNTGGDVVYGDRAGADARLLTYTSAPLQEDLEITGQPVVTLHVTSTHHDGAFFVYFEDVAPDGTVRYVTEGMLRAIHRKVSPAEQAPYAVLGPYHSFRKEHALPLVPGQPAELSFELMPTSVLIRAGHRIRVALAGADADTFRRIPETGTPFITVHRSRERPSQIRLPVVLRP